MLPLTDFDKLLIVVAAVFLVLVTALITACKTCPGCYLYYYCPLRRYFDERERRQKQEYQQILYYGPPYIPSVKQTSNGSYQTDKERKASLQATYPTPVLPALESKNLFASQLPPPYTSICTSREPSPNGHQSRGPLSSTSSSTTNDQYGDKPQVIFTLQYDKEVEKLTVEMKRAVNMPLNFLGTANDVFFRIFIIKDTKKRWRRKSDISLDDLSGKDPEFLVLTKFQTQTVRRAPHPEFNERFAAELKDLERRNSSLKLIAYVTDRFSQESTVGDVHVKLHRLEANSPKTFTLMLKETVHNFGEILVSLTYLPTAERLCVLIQKVTNLKAPEEHMKLNPYVRGCLLLKQKTVEKYKTAVNDNTTNPIFNETFTFRLPKDEIEKATVILTVLHEPADAEGENSRPNSPSVKSNSLRVRRRSVSNVLEATKSDPASIYKSRSSNSVRNRAIVLGRIAFGSTTQRETKAHWDEIIMTPRVQVTQLHKLRQ